MATVTVGCKIPNGLHLDLGDKRVTLNGANSSSIVGGHGITENVDKQFWDTWYAKNKSLDFVKNGHVFADEKDVNTKAKAKEREKEKSGLERLDPDAKPDGVTDLE